MCGDYTSSAGSTWTTGDQRPRPPHTPAGQWGGSGPDPLQELVLLSTEAAGAAGLLTGRARISTPGTCSRPGGGEQCWGCTHGRPRPLPAAQPPPQPPPAAVAAAPHQRASRPRVRAGDPAPAPAPARAPAWWSQGFAHCPPPGGLWSPGGSLRFSRGNSFLCSFPPDHSPPSAFGAALSFCRMWESATGVVGHCGKNQL